MADAGSVASKRPILYLFIGLVIGLAVAAVMAGLYAKTACPDLQSQYEYLQFLYNQLQFKYNKLLSSLGKADSYVEYDLYLAPNGFLVFPIIVPSGIATTHISAVAYTNSGWSNIYIAVYSVDDLNCIPNHSCPPLPIAESQCSPSISMDVTLSGPGQYAVVIQPCFQSSQLLGSYVNVQITTYIST